MIPIAFVAGAIAGRWLVVPVAAVAWGALGIAMGFCDLSCSPGAAGYAAANAAVGVALHQGIRLAGRVFRGRTQD